MPDLLEGEGVAVFADLVGGELQLVVLQGGDEITRVRLMKEEENWKTKFHDGKSKVSVTVLK